MPLIKLRLRNFQKHCSLTVRLDHRLTVFVGPNGSGKSAAFRAMRWCALNTPAGSRFLRHGAKEVQVEIEAEGGAALRLRSTGTNRYELNGTAYDALGPAGTVPQPVKDLLNLTPVNFQGQIDDPFWFLKTPGEVSRELNAVIDLSLIDTTLANLDAALRRARGSHKQVAEVDAALRAKVEALAWVDRAVEAHEELRRAEEGAAAVRLKTAVLAGLLTEGGRVGSALDLTLQARTSGFLARDKAEAAAALRAKVGRLTSLLAQAPGLPPPSALTDARESARILWLHRESLGRLKGLVEDAQLTRAQLCRAKKEYDSALTALRATAGQECPACGGTLRGV